MPVPTKLNCTLFYFTENSPSINAVLVLTFVDSAYRTDIWNTIACNLYGYIWRDQVNLLVYGPDRPYSKQKQKNYIAKFWPTGFFLIYYFLLF